MKFNGTRFTSDRQARAYADAQKLVGRVQALATEVARLDESSDDLLAGQKDQVLLSGTRSALKFESKAYNWDVTFEHANLDNTEGRNLRCQITESPRLKSGFLAVAYSAPMTNSFSEATLRSDEEGTVVSSKSGWTKETVTLNSKGELVDYKKAVAGIRIPV